MSEVYLVGGGGHAKIVISLLNQLDYKVAGIFDDNSKLEQVLEVKVIGDIESLFQLLSVSVKPIHLVMAIGNNQHRKNIISQLEGENIFWETIVHPSAIVDVTVAIGVGTVVCAGAIIQAEAKIGRHNIINTAATVDHDCVLSDFIHIAPGVNLAGNVQIQEGTFMGVGSSVIPQVSIGPWSVIGSGATVVEDLEGFATYIGLPAKKLDRL